MRRRTVLLAILLCLGALARANDRIGLDEVRFSAGSEHVLVLASGVRDGSGFGTASLTVLSTDSGRVLLQRTRTADLAPRVLQRNLLRSPSTGFTLGALGLRPGRLSAPRFQRAYPTPFPEWSDATLAGQTEVTKVALWSRPVPIRLTVNALSAQCPHLGMLPAGSRPAGFRLTVNSQVVHQDTALPPERRCAAGYTLERVDVRGNRALLTVRAYGPGFEGPDAAAVFVAVTLR